MRRKSSSSRHRLFLTLLMSWVTSSFFQTVVNKMIPPEFTRLLTIQLSPHILCVHLCCWIVIQDCCLIFRALEVWLAILQKEGNLLTEMDVLQEVQKNSSQRSLISTSTWFLFPKLSPDLVKIFAEKFNILGSIKKQMRNRRFKKQQQNIGTISPLLKKLHND